MSSNTMQAAERLVTAADFVMAVRGGDYDRADCLLPQLSGLLSDDCLQAAATLHMQRERWSDAADALRRIKAADPERVLHLNLCRNLAALRTHRAEIYRIIANADVADAYRVHVTPSGAQTIARIRENNHLSLLCAGADPRQSTAAVYEKLKPICDRGEPLGLLSIGDGYVLDHLARNSPTLFLGRQQAIFLFEPDPRLVLACMLIHDLTGPTGPIERDNVLWYVGPKWAEQFKLDILTNRFLPYPQITIKAGLEPKPIEDALQSILAELGRQDAVAAADVSAYYTNLPANHFADVLDGKLNRSPRLLMITTRFSTVLQYSTRDAADAFRQLGCEAQVLIEPSSHHLLSRHGMRRMLADFKPDLVFQIDHNRFEHADLFPQQLPFVNWIQDLLPHLMTPATGQKLASRDFVLAPSMQRWVNDYAYPAMQCLEFRKLTRVPNRPLSWASQSNRVVYVSNWSQSPLQIRDELLRNVTGKNAEVIASACDRMIAIYAAGESLTTPGDVRRLLISVLQELEVAGNESLVRETASKLFDRMNNLLFRQQGLRWAAEACGELGLKLDIFGNDWDKNKEFSPFARGAIEYGSGLEELTRSAGVNLVLEPFVCIAHQRCLDALAAGGFCLQRANPSCNNIRSIIECLAGVGHDVADTKSLESAINNDFDREKLRLAIASSDAADVSPGSVDHVATVRRLQLSGFLPTSGDLLPHIDQVTFATSDQMRLQLTRFTRDENLRSEIARAQRHVVQDRYSYTAGMKRMMAFLATRLTPEQYRIGKAA